jgi:ribose transport system permease protein
MRQNKISILPNSENVALQKVKGIIKKYGGLSSLLLIILLAIIISPHQRGTHANLFLTGANLSDIFRQVSENGIIAIGMTFIILTSGIDLSVGAILALTATFSAKLLTTWDPGIGAGFHIALAVIFPVLLATGCGALYGLLISKLKIQPFIVTLAGMIGFRGFARFLTTNANIDIGFRDHLSSVFADLVSPKPVVICTFVIVAVIMTIILSRTTYGLNVKSIGDNETASKYAGLPVVKTLIMTYALCGFLTGIAGILHVAQNHQGSPNDGMGYELDAIAAVVIGGTKMSGGKGSIPGTIIGVFIMGILTNIFRLKGVDINVEMMFKSVIIVMAVWLQNPRKKVD